MKIAIIEAWRKELVERRKSAKAAQQAARSGTRVDGSHRPANRGERGAVTAQGYLALGLGQRATELTENLRLLEEMGTDPRETLVVGAVGRVQIEGSAPKAVAIVPGGDATWLDVDLGSGLERVQYLSAASPLIHQLSGCSTGDSEEVELGGKVLEVRIIECL